MKITGDKHDAFVRHQHRILQFLKDKVKPKLGQVSQELYGQKNRFDLPEEELEQTRFTLALVGCFQCGKSTLFNYLCDGRELSPTGSGGGGIRTSGCRVSAHPLANAREKEYAKISWRSKEDLINSFGDVLMDDFPDLSVIDLDKANDCAKLKKKAWELYKRDTEGKKLDAELLRFVMIVAHFYPKYKERCAKGKEEKAPEKAAVIASYPRRWDARWGEVEKKGNINDGMSVFSVDDVAFAFCAGIDYYLDSENLRDLGCSIVDCPGFFASKWDTSVAEECLDRANAILYVFKGDTQLSEDDTKTIRECVDHCGKHKILFGANLKGCSRTQWRKISEESTSPRLAKIMGAPVEVYEFHAAMALRACELGLLENGSLSDISRQAINRDMEQEEIQFEKMDDFLKNQLGMYFAQMLKAFPSEEKDANDYEMLSGAPEFIMAASAVLVSRKGRSILIEQGIDILNSRCGRAKRLLEQYIKDIGKTKDDRSREFKEQKAKTLDFEEKQRKAIGELERGVEMAQKNVDIYCKEKVDELLEAVSYSDQFINVIAKHVDEICPDIREKRDEAPKLRDFFRDFGEVLASYSQGLQETLRNSLPSHGDITKLRDVYNKQYNKMTNDVKVLRYVQQDMSKLVPQFATEEAFAEAVLKISNIAIKDNMLKGEQSILGVLAKWLTLGGYGSARSRAEEIWQGGMKDTLLIAIKNQLHDSLYKSDRQPKGFCAHLNDICDDFKKPLEAELEQHKKSMEEFKKKLENAEENSAKVDEVYRPLLREVDELTEECADLEAQVDKAFPQMYN